MGSSGGVLNRAGMAAAAAIVAGLLACGGSSSPNAGASAPAARPATALVYAAPRASGYQLVQDASSTGSHLVLDLVGPQGAQIKGVLFSLSVDGTRASWGNPGGSDPYLKEGQVLALGTGTKLLKSQLGGSTLQAAIFQKGSVPAATLGNQPILSVALDLKAGASPGAVSLSSPAAQILDAGGATQAITVAAGTLTAQ